MAHKPQMMHTTAQRSRLNSNIFWGSLSGRICCWVAIQLSPRLTVHKLSLLDIRHRPMLNFSGATTRQLSCAVSPKPPIPLSTSSKKHQALPIWRTLSRCPLALPPIINLSQCSFTRFPARSLVLVRGQAPCTYAAHLFKPFLAAYSPVCPSPPTRHRPIIDLLFQHTSRPQGSVTFRFRSNTSARLRAHFFQEHRLQEILPILTLELSERMLEDSWHLTRDDSPFVLRPFLISHNQATTVANTPSILSHWSPRCIDLPSSSILKPRTSNSSRMAAALCIQPMCPPDLQFSVALPGRLKPTTLRTLRQDHSASQSTHSTHSLIAMVQGKIGSLTTSCDHLLHHPLCRHMGIKARTIPHNLQLR
ncbi:hypothetical protein BKA70DRAFT_373029 [Coprinopsis sp. MPI-PUGE-AT-0042]|nr:hypothetical protein BKA70DRAFT_373029 [Coprinopsis sp. MPI-PUGE-AT-0042]